MKPDKMEEIVAQWLMEEKKDNYVNTDSGLDSVCLDGYFDLHELITTLTKYHQDMISEVVEKIETMRTYTGGGSTNEKDTRVNKQEVLTIIKSK